MAISSKPKHLLFSLLTFLYLSFIVRGDIVSDLHSLRSQSPSGIIHLNETLLNRIFTLSGNPRSFYLIIFFDAIQLHNQPEPNLKSIKSEFAFVSKSFIINHNNNSSSSFFRIFFCDIEFSESEKEFLKFGVEVLPNIRIVPPNVNDLKSDSIPMDLVDHSSLAQSISDFIYSKTGLLVGKIHYPPIFTKIQLGFVVLGILLWMSFMIRKLILGETIFHNKKIWMFGTLFVYFFSVSGSMFILIRRIPLFVIDRKDPSKVVFFFNGNGMQFGAEGMCVGFLFTIVGFLLAFVTRVVVRIKDSMIQRVAMISAMIVSFWAVREVVRLSHWKTGYMVHAYLPSNWYKQ